MIDIDHEPSYMFMSSSHKNSKSIKSDNFIIVIDYVKTVNIH